jgi:hypothetical protein
LSKLIIILTYWTIGTFRCVLCEDRLGLSVQVWTGHQALFTEACSDPEDGAKRAEGLFPIFDDKGAVT